jgi:hypothetical protein
MREPVRCQATSVGDPTGGDDGCVAGHVDDVRHHHHRADVATVTSRLTALRDKDIGAGLKGRGGLTGVGDLLDPHNARIVCPGDQVGWYGEMERDSRGARLQRRLKGVLVERPRGCD